MTYDATVKPWPDGFSVSFLQRFRHRVDNTIWRTLAADFERNSLEIVNLEDERFLFRATVQEVLELFEMVQA